jgi:hypothetical protein
VEASLNYSQQLLPSKGYGAYLKTMTGNDDEPEEIDPAHLADVLEGLAQAKRREFATDAEIEAAFRRFEQKRDTRA